jgi:DNA gyrase subunit B
MTDRKEPEIVRLEPREHVRLRPGMYFGGTDKQALHQLVYFIVENSVEQAFEGNCSTIDVTLMSGNAVSISDNGLGIPVEIWRDRGLSFLELVATRPGSTGRWDKHRQTFTGSLFSNGVFSVNATSSEFKAEIRRHGYLWHQTYREGKRASDLIQVRPLEAGETTGTTITFTPDFSILQPNEFSYTALARRLRELAFLVPRLTLTLRDEREQPEGDEVSFHYPNGLSDFLTSLNRDYTPVHQPIHIREAVDMRLGDKQPYIIEVEAVFQYVERPASIILSYGNLLETPAGGTHVVGFLRGIALLVNILIQEKFSTDVYPNTLDEASFVPGLTAIISIKQQHVAFESANTMRLVNPDAEEGVLKATASAIHQFSMQHPDDMQRLVDHLLARKQERDKRRFGSEDQEEV